MSACTLAPAHAVNLPNPTVDEKLAEKPTTKTITVAGGCFWGVQAVFQHVKGVSTAVSGYAGGTADTAQYNTVSSGTTGHAEAVQVTYDSSQVTLGQILKVFFSIAHDPTQLNYQGPDHGTQYRSAIFTATPEQEKIARAYIAQLNDAKTFPSPIVTKLEKSAAFYPAEDYHQNFATLHPNHPYIVVNDAPKVVALEKTLPDIYRKP